MSEAIAAPMGTMHAEQLGDPSLVQQAVEQQESRRSWREQAGFATRKTLAIVGLSALGLAVAGGGIIAANRGEDGPVSPDAVPTAEEIVDLCEEIDFNEAAKDSAKYNERAFLPIADKVEDENGVRDYVSNLFKSPLGGDADMHSLAALMALVGEPANDGAGVDVNYDFLGTYAGKIQAYGGEGGAELAAKDCQKLSDTLKQVAKYNPEFVFKGDTITTFDAVRGAGNTIVNMSQDEAVSTDTYRAIELSLTSASRDLDEFNTVGIVLNEKGNWSGRIIATGINQGKNGKLALEGETPISVEVKDGVKTEITQLPNGEVKIETTDKNGNKTTEVVPAGECDVCEAPAPGNPTTPDGEAPAPGNPTTPDGERPAPGTPTTPDGERPAPGTPTTGTPTTGTPTTGTPTTAPHQTTTTQRPTTTVPQTTTTQRPTTTTTPQTTTTVRPTTTTTLPDVCPNIPGSQPSVPPGMEIRDGICKEKPPVGGGF